MAVVYFGENSSGTGDADQYNDYNYASYFQNTAGGGTITEMGIYLSANFTGKLRIGVYADSAGAPGALLLDAGEFTNPVAGWNNKTGLSLVVTASTYYWLAAINDTGHSAPRQVAGLRHYISRSYTSGFQNPYGTKDGDVGAALCIRAGVEATSDVNVPLTGVSGAASVGTLVLSAALALAGLAGTVAVGTLGPDVTVPISGIEAVASPGTMTPEMAAVAAGIEALSQAGTLNWNGSCSVGDVAPEATIPLAGETAAGEVGTLTADIGAGSDITIPITGVSANPAYPLGGIAAAAHVGTVEASTGVGADITIPITGVSANPSYPLYGVAAAGAVGTVTPVEAADIILPITGASAAGAVGDVSYLTMGGEAMTGEAGAVVPNISPPLTGVEATGAVGGLGHNRNVGLSGAAAVGQAGGFYNTLNSLTGEEATGAAGTLAPVVTLGITQVEGKGSVLPGVYHEPDINFVQYHDAPLSGAFGTGIVGYVYSFVEGDVVVAIAGISVTASVGELTCGVATPTYINVKPRKRILDVPPRQRIIDVHRRRS